MQKLLIVPLLPALVLFACTKEDIGAVEQPARTFMQPNKIFTGFNDQTEFLAVLQTNLQNPTFEVEDPTVATLVPMATPSGFAADDETGVKVTFVAVRALRPGNTRVIARAGTKDIDADITVTGYSQALLTLGRQRYESPDNANGTDRRSCAGCHQSQGGADHSPFTIGSFSDGDIVQAIETGTYKHGRSLFISENVPHAHDLTDNERTAIIAHLRSIRPSVLQ